MTSAMQEINNAANATAQYQAAQPKATGAAEQMGSQDFLNLMMKQLQYQDPMDPVSNTEFITQQAQFSQLETTQDMNTDLASSQAASLVGANVTITDPNNNQKTITGDVSSATIDGTSSSIKINGTDYPVSSLKSINDPYVSNPTTGTTDTSGTSPTSN